MKDVRLPLIISIPVALGFLGLVWYFKSKNDDSKKSKPAKKDTKPFESMKPVDKRSDVEKEGITMTQRKIPDRESDHTRLLSGGGDAISRGRMEEDNKINDVFSAQVVSKIDQVPSSEQGNGCTVDDVKVDEVMELIRNTGVLQGKSIEIDSISKISDSVEEESKLKKISCQMESANLPTDATNKLIERLYPSSILADAPCEVIEEPEISSSQGIVSEQEIFRSQTVEQTVAKDVILEKSDIENAEDIKENMTAVSSMPVSCAMNTNTEMDSGVYFSSDLNKSPEVYVSENEIKTALDKSSIDSLSQTVSSETKSQNSHGSEHEEHTSVVNGADIDDQSLNYDPAIETVDPDPDMDNLSQPELMTPSWSDQDTSLISEDVSDMVLSSGEVLKDDSSSRSASIGIGSKEVSPTKSSSPLCDSQSEGSNDSGRGPSDHESQTQSSDCVIQFDFNMPSELCGRFIGRQGKNINQLKQKSGANICLTHNPFTPEYQICQVTGTQAVVDEALAMIRRKFPVNDNPLLTMVPMNLTPPAVSDHPVIVPDVMQLSLPECASVEVYVSTVIDAGHVFIQQPTHRSFMCLEKLNYFLNTTYSQDPNIPSVPLPLEYGVICVCLNEGAWYRAMITSQEDEAGECQIKFVDYGGYVQTPVAELKQIRTDFMALPFQAVECYMGNITPLQSEQYYNDAATAALCELTSGKLLQCQVVARTETGVPHVHLYQIDADNNSAVMINRDLVNRQLVRWVELR